MEERCQNCPYLCKRLDDGEQPVLYEYTHLEPDEAVALLSGAIERFAQWHHLQIVRSEFSQAHQLAVSMRVTYMPDDSDNHLIFVAQARPLKDGCQLWLRYLLPDYFCQQAATRGLCTLIEEALDQIAQSDWLLSFRRA